MTRQRGASLLIALVMLSVILLLGAAGAALLVLDERAARHHRAHGQARLNAEAALEEACAEIALGMRVTASAFPSAQCRADAEGRGLCRAGRSKADGLLQMLSGAAAGAAVYGEFSGRRIAPEGVAAPRYLIERIEPTSPAGDGGQDDDALYRISAAGFGRGGATAGLQQVVRRQADASGQARCLRLAWRTLPLEP
jgi:type IV pilus assembly protein PilX